MVYDFLPTESIRTFHLEILKFVCSMKISQLMCTPNYSFFSYEVYVVSIAEISFNFDHRIIKKTGCMQMEWVYWQKQQSCNFPRICRSLMSDLNGTKFTMEVPSTQGRPHSKFPSVIPEIRAIKLSKKIFIFFFFLHTLQKSL